MSTEKFRVKFGLQVGDSAATIDGTSGDITTSGDLYLNGNSIKSNGGNNAIELNGFDISTGDIQLNGGDIKSSSGTTAISVSGADAVIAGDLTVTGNDIKSSSATAITLSGADVAVVGDLTVTGNDIKSSSATALTLSGADVTVVGDLTVTGNDIKSSAGVTAITLSSNDVSIAGDLTLSGDLIKSSDGTSTITTSTGNTTVLGNLNVNGTTTLGNSTSDNVTVSGDLTVTGNDIKSSTGTTVITLSDADATIAGNIRVNGNNIVSSTGANAITLSGGNVVSGGNIAGDSLTTNGGYIYAPGGLGLTLSSTNTTLPGDLTVTGNDIKSSTGDTAITLSGSDVTITGNLTVNGTTTNINSTNLVVEDKNIILADVTSPTDTTADGGGITLKGATDKTITWLDSNDSWNFNQNIVTTGTLDVQGGTITDSTGALSITTGASNGAITLAPNGSGDIVLTLANGGNLSNTRNYITGTIRNSTSEGQGDIFAVLSGATPTSPFRGVSISNSDDTSRGPGTILRSYSGGATSGSPTRGRLVFEKSRGTAASPTAIQSGDLLGSIDATGYTSTGWINDQYNVVPGFFGFAASENWVSNTNLGMNFTLSLPPTATTVTTSANLVQVLNLSPEANQFRSDRLAISQGKTAGFVATGCSTSGTTLTIGTLTSGTIAVGQVIFATGPANGHYIVANISGSGSGSTWTLGGSPGTLTGLAITGNAGFIGSVPATSTTTDILQDLRLVKNTIKGSTGTTQIATSASGTTLGLSGDTTNINLANGTNIAAFSDAKILNNRPHRSAVTTATIARGTTYTPAAGVNNFIELTLTAGTDPTYIDVDNLTVAGEGGHQAILVYNNSGSAVGNGDLVIRNNGTTINSFQDSIANGGRVIFTVYCIGNYASCEYMSAA